MTAKRMNSNNTIAAVLAATIFLFFSGVIYTFSPLSEIFYANIIYLFRKFCNNFGNSFFIHDKSDKKTQDHIKPEIGKTA